MDEYITKKELREWVESWFAMDRCYHPYAKSNNIPTTELYDILERIPSAAVVPLEDYRSMERTVNVLKKALDDAVPVIHGRWEQAEIVHDRKDAKIQDWQQAQCSVCGRWQTKPVVYYLKLDKYCPNCGAKMDEEPTQTQHVQGVGSVGSVEEESDETD